MISSNQHIDRYIRMIEEEEVRTNKEIKALIKLIKKTFKTEDVYIDHDRLNHYLNLAKYLPWKQALPWEEFLMGLHTCVFNIDTGLPRWPDLFLLTGRGTGKDGFMTHESMALISQYNGITAYNIDICANSKDQAIRPVTDLVDAFDDPTKKRKLQRHFYWTKERVKSKHTKSLITGHTTNFKTKDGLRPGAVFFNELHQYEHYKNIEVYISALGKVEHPRTGYFTSEGYVREGPLDDMEKDAEDVLFGDVPDNGTLYALYRLNDIKQVDDEKNWVMANPSLPHFPTLMETTRRQYTKWKKDPEHNKDFIVKRMGIKQDREEIAVTSWENIKATNKPVPDMIGKSCVIGIDFTKVNDWASVNCHFLEDETRIDESHTWVCMKSKDLHSIKAPWRDWANAGRLTVVDDLEINPRLLGSYVAAAKEKYQVKAIAMDSFRYTVFAPVLAELGFSKENKNLWLVRPSDIMKIVPVIDRCFTNHWFVWGDAPELRWATNNAKLIPVGKNDGLDKGNFEYGKIEAKARKTDPFMALVAAMTIEDRLRGEYSGEIPDLDIIC